MAEISISIRKSNPEGGETNMMISGSVDDSAMEEHFSAITALLTQQVSGK